MLDESLDLNHRVSQKRKGEGGIRTLGPLERGQLISNQSPSTTRPPLHAAKTPVFRVGVTEGEKSAPKRTRTSDLWFRKPSLYPAELWAHVIRKKIKTAGHPSCRPVSFPGTLSYACADRSRNISGNRRQKFQRIHLMFECVH